MKEVELELVFGFPIGLLSLARLKYLALSDMYLDIDEDPNWRPPSDIALEGLYLIGVSLGATKTLTRTLSSADDPPTLRKLALNANVRGRICQGGHGADHSVRVASYKPCLVVINPFP